MTHLIDNVNAAYRDWKEFKNYKNNETTNWSLITGPHGTRYRITTMTLESALVDIERNLHQRLKSSIAELRAALDALDAETQ